MTGGVALVLGRTGRNFGAGMSGGIAYVLDLVRARVNKQSLDTGELLLQAPDAADNDLIASLLKKHAEETGSQLAAELLQDISGTLSRITKVLPRDYAAVLQARSVAETEGLDPDGDVVWKRILEVTGG
jgi:glutamate synthase (NADPH) large chain